MTIDEMCISCRTFQNKSLKFWTHAHSDVFGVTYRYREQRAFALCMGVKMRVNLTVCVCVCLSADLRPASNDYHICFSFV